jgi:hypothetical protein
VAGRARRPPQALAWTGPDAQVFFKRILRPSLRHSPTPARRVRRVYQRMGDSDPPLAQPLDPRAMHLRHVRGVRLLLHNPTPTHRQQPRTRVNRAHPHRPGSAPGDARSVSRARIARITHAARRASHASRVRRRPRCARSGAPPGVRVRGARARAHHFHARCSPPMSPPTVELSSRTFRSCSVRAPMSFCGRAVGSW